METLSKKQRFEDALSNPYASFGTLGEVTLYEFLQIFWSEVCSDPFKTNWHVVYLCEELEKIAYRVGGRLPKEHDVIINIPPGTTKTLICSVMFPAWCWTRWYWMKFITGSYSSDLALEAADKTRDIIQSDKFRRLYPNVIIKEDKNTKSNYRIALREVKHGRAVLTLGGGRYSTSVGGTITGFHGHINIWDDPINPKQAASDLLIKTANDWVDKSGSTRKADKDISTVIMVMQRLHQDDPSGHVLDKEGKRILHICLPGEIKNYRAFVKPPELVEKYTNDLLDPIRLSWTALKELEADLGVYGYAGQIGQNPVPPGGGMFQVEHFQMVDRLPSAVHILYTIRYWDKAATEGGGCFTSGTKICRLSNGKYIVMDNRRGQWAVEKRELIILQTAEADGMDTEVWVEQEPGSGGKESAQDTIRNLAGFKAFAERPVGDKIYRAGPYAVQVNNGNVYLLRGDWNKEFINEHRFFPFGKNKDQVDSAAAAFMKAVGKKLVRRII